MINGLQFKWDTLIFYYFLMSYLEFFMELILIYIFTLPFFKCIIKCWPLKLVVVLMVVQYRLLDILIWNWELCEIKYFKTIMMCLKSVELFYSAILFKHPRRSATARSCAGLLTVYCKFIILLTLTHLNMVTHLK